MSLTQQIGKLAAFGPVPYPVVSLYLNTQPGQTGRDQHRTFVRKELDARIRTYPTGSADRQSLDADRDSILGYLENDLQPSANGVAIFACSAGELFEAVQLAAPVEQHWLYISDQPHLYPLARLESQHPAYAAVVADTNTARILVFDGGAVVANEEVKGVKTKRSSQGGSAQARFQRHVENFHLHHAKEVVDALERIVRKENISQIFLAGDEVILPLLRSQMPKALAEKVVDHIKLDTHAPVDAVMRASLEALKGLNERSDREKVDAAIGGYRSGGLGMIGAQGTLDALIKGQVDELLIASSLRNIQSTTAFEPELAIANETGVEGSIVEVAAAGEPAGANRQAVWLADELVTKAHQTGARVTFIEDPALLAGHGGAAALLRFRS